MSGTMSKRQAARNEKALQELVRNTTGNNVCADCEARNPPWASWSLGIFLCMPCAAIHRKLGTHISKVKSLSMDSWSNEQVDNMRKVGNLASNKIYNPQGKKPAIPVDVDEVDSAMERFIRQKYMKGGFKAPKRNSHSSTVSDEGTPPPPPPKTSSKFGLKGASSLLSLGSRKRDKNASATPSGDGASGPHPPPASASPPRNKASKVFGASVDSGVGDETEKKMTRLRDMGFTDDQRNTLILKGMHGNMEKTVEALVRLGEGGRLSSLPTPTDPSATSRSSTPITLPNGFGLGVATPTSSRKPASAISSNPFDNIQPAAQPQSSQSTGTMSSTTNNPFLQQQQQQQQQPQLPSTNPFGMPSQQQNGFGLTQSLQNMNLAPTQSLFPNHTGGIPVSQATSQPYQQSMTPPTQPTQNLPPINFNSTMSYPPQVTSLQQQPTGYNPFMQLQNAQSSAGLLVSTNGAQGAFGASNPFTRSPTCMQSPSPLAQIPEAAPQNEYISRQPLQPPSSNPFLAGPTSAPMQAPAHAAAQQPQQFQQPQFSHMQSQFQQPQVQQQQMMMYQQAQHPQPQQPQRPETASIMALFDYPQLAPPKPEAQQPAEQSQADGLGPGFGRQPQVTPLRSVSTPLPGNNNPFMAATGGSAAAANATVPRSQDPTGMNGGVGPSNHASKDSVALGMDMAWTTTNGRHSPDAFASLSARAGR